MMNLVRRVLVLLSLALGVIPGGIELAGDAAHLALEGHLDDGDCADECDDSGCTPGSHACSCCAALRVAPSVVSTPIASAAEAGVVEWLVREGGERPSFARGVCRPPNA